TVTGGGSGKGLRAQLIRGSVGSVGLKGASALLHLLPTALLTHNLTTSEFGVYAYVLATISLLAIPAHAGMPTLIVRLTAIYQARDQLALLAGLWIRSRQLLMILSLAIMLLTSAYFIVIGGVLESGDRLLQLTLAAALLMIPIKSIAESRAAALRGLGRVVIGQMPDLLVRPLTHALLITAFLLAPWIGMSAPLAMALYTAAALCAMIFATMALSRYRPAASRSVAPAYETRVWLRTIVPLSLLAGSQVILQQTGSVMLGAISGPESVGLYRIAVLTAAVVGFGMLTASTVISPHVARMYATGDLARAQAMITSSARIVSTTTLALTLVIVVIGEPFIRLVFGAHYVAAYLPLITLCAGVLIKAAAGPASAVLTMTGHERDAFAGVASAAVANVVFCALLIPAFGIQGAALGSTLAFSVWSLQVARLAYKRTKFHTTVFGAWHRGSTGTPGT
ncbi:MAG: polysaccharide biosynthesis C-terminal domain-containing protein, partial [Steroidobacteraceae bacterium]